MRFTSSISLLSLALSIPGTHASPTGISRLMPRTNADPDIEALLTNRNEWCWPSGAINDFETADHVQWMTTLSGDIALFLRTANKGKPDEWVKEIRKFILHKFEDGETAEDLAGNCARTGANCQPGEPGWSCFQYFDMGNPSTKEFQRYDWGKLGFYIFKAVANVNSMMTEVEKYFTGETLAQSLEIPSLAEELQASLEHDVVDISGFMNGLSIALSISSTVAGALPGAGAAVSAGLGLLGTVVDNIPEEDAGEVKISQVQSQLAARFRTAQDLTRRILAASMGEAYDQEDYKLLDQHMPKWEKSDDQHIANFFSQSFWLLDPNSKIFRDLLAKMTKMMRQQLMKSMLTASGIEIVGRNGDSNDSENKDQCEGSGNPGRRWIEVDGKSWCFGLSKKSNWHEMDWDSNVYSIMHGYGIDIFSEFYKNALECERSGGRDENGRPSKMDMTGEYPRCFFDIPVRRAWYFNPDQFSSRQTAYEPFFESLKPGYKGPGE